MQGKEGLKDAFNRNQKEHSCAIIEGVMGLYDGVSADSDFGSSAHIASILNIPVILVINASGVARSIAATVLGYCSFMPKLNIVGVIANKVGSKKHAKLLNKALQSKDLPPLLGYLTKEKSITLPERHLGLVPEVEKTDGDEFFDNMATIIESSIDIDQLLEKTDLTNKNSTNKIENFISKKSNSIKIGVAKDKAFSFYYPENLRALEIAGAEIIYFSPLLDTAIPPNIDMLYIGGGYPEIFAKELSENSSMRKSIKKFVNSFGVLYAECGGLMYLSETLEFSENVYDMCGVIPAQSVMEKSLRRLGYREIVTMQKSILGEKNSKIRGHEFHFSKLILNQDIKNIYKLSYPKDAPFECCGYLEKNILASYAHLYWGNRSDIAENIINWVLEKKNRHNKL